MNTHNDFLNNAVNDELETEGIENLTTPRKANMGPLCCSESEYAVNGSNKRRKIDSILWSIR